MDTLNLRDFLTILQNHGQNIADECAVRVAAHAPVGNGETAGRLRDSIHGEAEPQGDGLTVTITADAPEAEYVIFGTAPHDIDPRHPKEALFWPGAEHPYAHVHHPGSQPNDFGQTAMDGVLAACDDEIEAVAAEWGAA